MNDRERAAMQQALEALEHHGGRLPWNAFVEVRKDLCAALAQEQAEPVQPVAWRFKPMVGSPWSMSDDGYYISCKRDQGYFVEPLYTAPPQRRPLTVDAIGDALSGVLGIPHEIKVEIARDVERAHGIGEEK